MTLYRTATLLLAVTIGGPACGQMFSQGPGNTGSLHSRHPGFGPALFVDTTGLAGSSSAALYGGAFPSGSATYSVLPPPVTPWQHPYAPPVDLQNGVLNPGSPQYFSPGYGYQVPRRRPRARSLYNQQFQFGIRRRQWRARRPYRPDTNAGPALWHLPGAPDYDRIIGPERTRSSE